MDSTRERCLSHSNECMLWFLAQSTQYITACRIDTASTTQQTLLVITQLSIATVRKV